MENVDIFPFVNWLVVCWDRINHKFVFAKSISVVIVNGVPIELLLTKPLTVPLCLLKIKLTQEPVIAVQLKVPLRAPSALIVK